MRKYTSALAALALSFAGAASSLADESLDALKSKYRRPSAIPFPASAPYSPQVATLGKMLFFDPRLSGRQNLSCASCHSPSFGYELPVPGAIGAANVPLGRKAPTVLNTAFVAPLFWDGRANSLEDQAQGPITAAAEMDGKFDEIVTRLRAIEEYDAWFKRLYPQQGASKDTILAAIATFERTVVSGAAPFDRWIEGEETAISDEAKRGFTLFNGAAGCSACHSGWNFTDNRFHSLGIEDADVGRGKYEPDNPKAQHAFKTPGLRNIESRAPYGHAGQFATLAGIVDFYDGGGGRTASKDPLMQPLGLNASDKAALVAFLRSLTAEDLRTPLPLLPN